MIIKPKILHICFLLTIIAIAYLFGDKYTYADIKDILSTLQNISAMIFTIAGIWLAYIYPAAVSSIVKPSTITSINYHKETEKDIERITLIVKTIIISAIVIFSIVIINLTKPIFSNLDFISLHKHVFCKLGFFITALLVYLQIIALFSIIASNILFLNDIHDKRNKRELDKLR